MKRIFVDTNGWIALNSKRDQFHGAAIDLNTNLLNSGYRYVTTNYILDETYTGILMKVGHKASVDFGERIRRSNVIVILNITKEIEEEAWMLFKRYADKEYSFTDCTSFVIMSQLELSEAFTNDRHFTQMGYKALLQQLYFCLVISLLLNKHEKQILI